MNFIIGQIISFAALIIASVSAQFKNIKYVLIGGILSNASVALSFIFLRGESGAWICIVGAVQTLIIYIANKYQITPKWKNVLTVVFVIIYISGTAVVYRGWNDVVSCVAAMLYVMAISQNNTKKYRAFMLANSSLWIVYDITVLAFVNIITHGMEFVSLIIAVIRMDIKRK